MNVIFTVIFLLAALLFLFFQPNAFLPALLSGGQKAATLSLSLLAIYCVWLGFFGVMEKSGLSGKLSRALSPACGRLFRSKNKKALQCASCNLSANLLGLPGAPTPLGVQATKAFFEEGNGYGAYMLFVLNATSLQLLPTTVITLRSASGSLSPADIFFPTLLTTLLSTIVGIALTRLILGKTRKK